MLYLFFMSTDAIITTGTIATEFGVHASYENPDSICGMSVQNGRVSITNYFKSIGTWYTIPDISIIGTNSSRNKRVKVVVSFGLNMNTKTSASWSCSMTMGIRGLFGEDYTESTSFTSSSTVYSPTYTNIFNYIQENQEMGTYVIPGFQVAITSATGNPYTSDQMQGVKSQARVDVYADLYN